MISAYALGVVLGAPIIAALAAKLPRKTLLLLLMAVFAIGNFASALATEFTSSPCCALSPDCRMVPISGVAALVAPPWRRRNRRVRAVGA